MSSGVNYSNRGNFDLIDNKIMIALLSIDQSRKPVKKLNLILDTGAFITIINKKAAILNDYRVIEGESCHIRGFSEKGLLCDLRLVPTVIFCGYEIKDVIIATPKADGIIVSEVLGMNILENFNFGFDLCKQEIYINKRNDFISNKPRYQSGEVNVSNYFQST